MTVNKKMGIIITIILLLISIFIVVLVSKNTKIQTISIDKFEQLIHNDDTAVVYYGQENCGACNAIFPAIKEIASELNLEINYLDADKINDTTILSKWNIEYTPTIIMINDGQVTVYDDLNTDNIYEILSEQSNIIFDRPDILSEISYEDLKIKMSSNIDFILYIGRSDCRDCEKFQPIIEDYISNNNKNGAYYFNIKEFRDRSISVNASDSDIILYDNLKKEFDIQWFPSVYHIINGKIESKYEYLSEDYYKIDNDYEKEKAEKDYIEKFYQWMSNTTNKF